MSRRTLAAIALCFGLVGAPCALPAAAATKPAAITLKTATHGGGAHPVLRWKRVPRASRYLLSVNTVKGAPYWSWTGTESKVRFGGGPLGSSRRAGGAALTRKMRWFVVAFDDSGVILAASKLRSIAP